MLLMSFHAFSQLSVGPKVGVNFAYTTIDISDHENGSKSPMVGVNGGVALNAALNKMLSFQAEILYSQQGVVYEYDHTIGTETVAAKSTFVMNYLRIPVLVKLSFGPEETQFYVNGGPYMGYWLDGTKTEESGGSTDESEYEFDDDNVSYNRLDVGLSFGAGVSMEAGPGSFIIDLRYGLGFMDINDNENEPDDYTPTQHRVPSLTVGYLFKFD